MAQETGAPPPAKTIIEDQAEADLLLGRHLFTQFRLSYTFVGDESEFGEAIITKNDGVYTIKADHSCYFRTPRYPKYIEGGYIRIQGEITKIENQRFTIKGTLNALYDSDFAKDDGRIEKCAIETKMVFSRQKDPENLDLPEGDLPYWSLENVDDIWGFCKEQINFPIYIYIKQYEGPAPVVDCSRTLESVPDSPYAH